MTVYLVYELNDRYPYAIIKDSIHVFTSREKAFEYMNAWYDDTYPTEDHQGMCDYWGVPDWETYKETCIANNDNEYIEWVATELE